VEDKKEEMLLYLKNPFLKEKSVRIILQMKIPCIFDLSNHL